MATVEIEVTAEDIAEATRLCGDRKSLAVLKTCCPIALAARRATGADAVLVDVANIFAGPIALLTPGDAEAFMEAFDYGDTVEPTRFVAEIAYPRDGAEGGAA